MMMMMLRLQIALVVLLPLVSCKSRDSATRPRPVAPSPAVTVKADLDLLRTLEVLATQREPSRASLDKTALAIDSGRLTVDAYIDSLVASEDFAKRVAPLAILRAFLSIDADGAPLGKVLNRTDGAKPLYYLSEKPCDVAKAVPVRPWWNPASEILVCGDAILPDKWTTEGYNDLPAADCLSQIGGGSPTCGCGPGLMRCFESEQHLTQATQSLRDELRGTIEWVVSHDLPAEQIFTSNSTFRDRNAEFLRRLDVLHQRRDKAPVLDDLAAWPETGRWAPREELATGQHAGILTSALLLQNQADRRQRMSVIYDVMWCTDQDSVGASPESIISIKGNNLQLDSDGWRELAARPLCTNCHARLDYGMQFFWGYPNGYMQAYFVPGLQQKGKGELFAANHDDPRGTAELNPKAFSELAVTQPEFRNCMARDVAAYVLGNQLTPARLEQIASLAKPNATSVRTLMRASLQALVEDWKRLRRTVPVLPAAAASDAAAGVSLTPALATHLQTHCLDCHDADPERADLSKQQLPRSTVIQLLSEVAFGRMPEGAPLPDDIRRALIDDFVSATWTGADAVAARNYFVSRMQALPAYRSETVFERIHALTGKAPPSIRVIEPFIRSDLQQVTPGLATVSSVAAIASCRAAKQGRPRAEIDRCIDEVIRLGLLAIDPRPTP